MFLSLLFAISFVCVLPLRVLAQDDECTGPGSEHYDLTDDPRSVISGNVVWYDHTPAQPLCGDTGAYMLQHAQLFTPPQIPWQFTRVCFALGLEDSPYRNKTRPFSLEVHGTVSVYPVTVSPVAASLKPGDRLSYAAFSKTVKYTPPREEKGNVSRIQYQWFSVDLGGLSTPLVAWDQGAFVGVQFMSCFASVVLVGVRQPGQGRLNVIVNGGWRPVDGVDAVAIRTVGRNYSGVPPAWSCDPKLYNDGSCDCECGTGDIDCSRDFSVAYGCAQGEICDQSGKCIGLDWDGKGRCTAANYWHYDGCQCECGAVPDPDCYDPYATLHVCNGSYTMPYCFFDADYGNKSRPFSLEVHGTVSVYPVTVSPVASSLRPGERLSYAGFSKTVKYTPWSMEGKVRIPLQWFSVDLDSLATPLVAWDEGVFVGVQYTSCYAIVRLVGDKRTNGKGRVNAMLNGAWGPVGGITAVAIRTVGRNHSDIDCSRNFSVARGCRAGMTCDQLDWGEGPCTAANYWHYDGCQCQCGSVPDPDCFDPYAPLS
eukprot:m51a1_g4104 hypothetical protein (538) ;mRNA; f:103888-109416